MGEVPRIRVDRRSIEDLRKSSSTITRLFGVRLILPERSDRTVEGRIDTVAERPTSAPQRFAANERTSSAVGGAQKENDDVCEEQTSAESSSCSHRARNENEVVVQLEILHGALSGSFYSAGECEGTAGGGGGGNKRAGSGELGTTLDEGLDASSRSVFEIAARVQKSLQTCRLSVQRTHGKSVFGLLRANARLSSSIRHLRYTVAVKKVGRLSRTNLCGGGSEKIARERGSSSPICGSREIATGRTAEKHRAEQASARYLRAELNLSRSRLPTIFPANLDLRGVNGPLPDGPRDRRGATKITSSAREAK